VGREEEIQRGLEVKDSLHQHSFELEAEVDMAVEEVNGWKVNTQQTLEHKATWHISEYVNIVATLLLRQGFKITLDIELYIGHSLFYSNVLFVVVLLQSSGSTELFGNLRICFGIFGILPDSLEWSRNLRNDLEYIKHQTGVSKLSYICKDLAVIHS
jgi:hypothetical protein